MSDVALRDGITEIVAHHDAAEKKWAEALEKVKDAKAAIADAQSELLAACGGKQPRLYGDQQCDELQSFYRTVDLGDPEAWLRTANRLTRATVWASIIERTDMDHLMDRELKAEREKALAYVPERTDPRTGAVINEDEQARSAPPITEENIILQLEGLVEDAPDIFRRGLANSFACLDRRFRSHDGFSIGARIILSDCFSASYGPNDLHWNYSRHQRDNLVDIERALLVLDGRGPRAAYAGIVGAVDAYREAHRGQTLEFPIVIQGDYFRLRTFKNGNAHLWFERDDLVRKANLELAKFYGAAMGEGKDRLEDEEAPLAMSVVGHARNLGYFPTPAPIVERLIEEANLHRYDSSPPLMVLEPSAGDGALILQAAKDGHIVHAIELDRGRAQTLAQALPDWCSVRCADFLTSCPRSEYDRVLMNPPFDRGMDVDHVFRAWQWLRPGGRLVAVMSAGTEFREDKKTAAFRALVKKAAGRFWDLPAGSFAPATNVNTVLVIMNKPEEVAG